MYWRLPGGICRAWPEWGALIAQRTATIRRMLSYHFGSRERRYATVPEQAYAGRRSAESGFAPSAPDRETAMHCLETAMRCLIEATFDYDGAHPDLVRLIAIENINQGAYLDRLDTIRQANVEIVTNLSDSLERGRAVGYSPWRWIRWIWI
jgi:Tetracyclin repressor-like, C-terminal domain